MINDAVLSSIVEDMEKENESGSPSAYFLSGTPKSPWFYWDLLVEKTEQSKPRCERSQSDRFDILVLSWKINYVTWFFFCLNSSFFGLRVLYRRIFLSLGVGFYGYIVYNLYQDNISLSVRDGKSKLFFALCDTQRII